MPFIILVGPLSMTNMALFSEPLATMVSPLTYTSCFIPTKSGKMYARSESGGATMWRDRVKYQ